MPLPNADPDKRMYALLKNIDLENLSFADFQNTAEKVFAEPESEDTLRRIVLINLSRMAVAGDWNGLTTAAAGGGLGLKIAKSWNSTYSKYAMGDVPPYGSRPNSGVNTAATWEDKVFFYPFVAQVSGQLSQFGLKFSAAGGYGCAIYDVDSNYLPSTLLAKGNLTTAGAATVYQGTLTGSGGGAAGTITEGNTYWVAFVRLSGHLQGAIWSVDSTYRSRVAATIAPDTTAGNSLKNGDYNQASGFPDTVTNTNTVAANTYCPRLTYEVA